MIHVWPIYGALLAAVVVRVFLYAGADMRLAMLALSADWLATNVMFWVPVPGFRTIGAESDLIFALGFFLAWFVYERQWMAAVASLYLISGLVGFLAYDDTGSKYSFDLALNAAFLARLAVVWIASFEPRTLRNAHE